jgi:ABC-2 type transport system permease protein
MQAIAQIVAVILKELRELLHRPILVLTLILGPLAVLIVFGLGSNVTPAPPRTIVVGPPGQEEPRLLQEYQREFNQFLNITEYTDDQAYARAQLRRKAVDAVLILPPTPFETIASGQPATFKVLYNEIDPIWRGLVPQFVGTLAGEINRALFLQTAAEQRGVLTDAASDMDLVLQSLDQAIAATENEDWQEVRQQVRDAIAALDRLSNLLSNFGPEAMPMLTQVERARTRLQQVDQLLELVEGTVATPTQDSLDAPLRLRQIQQSLQALRDAIDTLLGIPPNVVISPLTVETELVARLSPDVMTFFAPTIVALLIQHIAVSLGALAIVQERLTGSFDLYTIAPISNLRLLLGKYIAYILFTLAIAVVLLVVLLLGLNVPVFGSLWRLSLTLLLLALASVGLGFAISLLATSERQAVQLSMLALLGIVFFSGFILPLFALRQPALSISYAMPATYGVVLLQDIMLRGLPGNNRMLLTLAAIAAGLFILCFGLLWWRTRPQ